MSITSYEVDIEHVNVNIGNQGYQNRDLASDWKKIARSQWIKSQSESKDSTQ